MKKKSSADEFLVEKKSPLVLPPDYNKLPLPDDKIKDENETKMPKDAIDRQPRTKHTGKYSTGWEEVPEPYHHHCSFCSSRDSERKKNDRQTDDFYHLFLPGTVPGTVGLLYLIVFRMVL